MAEVLSRSEKHRIAELKWRNAPPGLSPDLEKLFMRKLVAGSTLRRLTNGGKRFGPALATNKRFKKHCELRPTWGKRAMRLARRNAKATEALKSPKLYKRLCKYGHDLDQGRIYFRYGYVCRRCRRCDKLRNARAGVLKPGQIERATAALKNGVTISQICHGRPMGGGPRNSSLIIISPVVFYRYRLQNPGFNNFVRDAIESRISLRDPIAGVAPGTFRYDWDPADMHAIPAMLPDYFPGKNDAVQTIFVNLIEGRLNRGGLKPYIRWLMSQHSREHGKFAKFGNSPLLSLDEVLYDDSSRTKGDTVSRGLWDD